MPAFQPIATEQRTQFYVVGFVGGLLRASNSWIPRRAKAADDIPSAAARAANSARCAGAMRISSRASIPDKVRKPAGATIHRLLAGSTTTLRVIRSPRIRFQPSGRPPLAVKGAKRTGGLPAAAGEHSTALERDLGHTGDMRGALVWWRAHDAALARYSLD